MARTNPIFNPPDIVDEIVASCNGDMRGAVKALLLVNEQLESDPGPPSS